MELEEAIERLETILNLRLNKANEIKYDNCIISTEDLQIILNYIKEESIPRAVVEEKIEEMDKEEMTIYIGGRSNGKTFKQAVHNEVKRVLQEILTKGEK